MKRILYQEFPSPTGVNHYELYTNIQCVEMLDNTKGFRPQQGLTIMNGLKDGLKKNKKDKRFRPQQGLTIMNKRKCNPNCPFRTVSVPNRG